MRHYIVSDRQLAIQEAKALAFFLAVAILALAALWQLTSLDERQKAILANQDQLWPVISQVQAEYAANAQAREVARRADARIVEMDQLFKPNPFRKGERP